MRVLFIAGFGPVVPGGTRSRRLYRDRLGIRFRELDGYLHTEKVDGARSFALWPLSHAARSCFGSPRWPKAVPRPQAWLEFDVDDVEKATRELERAGTRFLVRSRTEPWGQVVSRFLSPEGLLVGLTYTPWMRPRPRKRRTRKTRRGAS